LGTHYTKLYKACQAPSQRATKEAHIGAWKAVEVEKASIRSLFLKEAHIGAWKVVEVEKASIRSLFLKEALDVAKCTRE
jgi:G:T/U-mismatch repair DNA glycosylase